MSDFPCTICSKTVLTDAIECSLCYNWCHRICAKLSKQKLKILSDSDQYWYCKNCLEIFPFSNVDDNELAFITSNLNVDEEYFNLYTACKSIELDCVNHDELEFCDLENEFQPDKNIFNELERKCDYYTNDEFCGKVTNNYGLSFIHFNCRSLKANFVNLHSYLQTLKKTFDVIALSETWLNNNDNINDFFIDNYEIIYTNRSNKRGGGVLIYVSKCIEFELMNSMSIDVDDMLEVVTIKLKNKKEKDILFSCMYRSPGGCLDNFNSYFQDFLCHVGNKAYILCGDFNINLFKY